MELNIKMQCTRFAVLVPFFFPFFWRGGGGGVWDTRRDVCGDCDDASVTGFDLGKNFRGQILRIVRQATRLVMTPQSLKLMMMMMMGFRACRWRIIGAFAIFVPGMRVDCMRTAAIEWRCQVGSHILHLPCSPSPRQIPEPYKYRLSKGSILCRALLGDPC